MVSKSLKTVLLTAGYNKFIRDIFYDFDAELFMILMQNFQPSTFNF